MARGKNFQKRTNLGQSAVSAEEIELRNARLAEVEERRAQRRADEEDDGEGAEGGDDKDSDKTETKANTTTSQSTGTGGGGKPKDASSKPPAERGPVVVTTEYDHKQNMKKLALVKKRREEAEAKRKSEAEAAEAEEAARIAAAKAVNEDGKKQKKEKEPKIPKLDKIAIKKMKPAQMKEALKVRGLEIQGNAKALTERLLKYEAER